jgi:hypothetical protein
MEWLCPWEDDPENLQVDIGYVPKMKLISTGKSEKNKTFTETESDINEILSNIQWDEEIKLEEGIDILERAFYPFKKVF